MSLLHLLKSQHLSARLRQRARSRAHLWLRLTMTTAGWMTPSLRPRPAAAAKRRWTRTGWNDLACTFTWLRISRQTPLPVPPYPSSACVRPSPSPCSSLVVGVRAGTARSSLASSQRPAAPCARIMLFASFFKTLVGKQITVELKNDLAIVGTLHSVDQVRPSPARCACSASWR